MKKNKYKLNIILIVVVAFIVVYFTLKDDFNSVIEYFANINYLWILVAIGFYILNVLFQALAQFKFLKEVKKDYKISSCFKLMLMAMFFNGITPFSTGGQPFEMYLLNKEGIKVSDSANALLQNFITYQFSLIFMGTVALIANRMFGIITSTSVLRGIVFLGFLINVIVMLVILFISRGKKTNTKIFNKLFNFIFHFKFIKNREAKKEKASKMLDDFYNSTAIMKNNLKNTLLSVLYNTLSLVCLYTVAYFVFLALGSKVELLDAIVASAYIYLVGSFVPIPGGTGGLEYAFIQFFGAFFKGGLLSAAMLLWRLITYYLGMLIGGITLITYRRKE